MFSKLVNWQQVPSEARVTRVCQGVFPSWGGGRWIYGRGRTVGQQTVSWSAPAWGGHLPCDLTLCHPVPGQWPGLRLYQDEEKLEAGSRRYCSRSLLRSSSCPHPPRIQDRVPLRSLDVRTEIVSNPVPMISCHSVWSEAVRENQWECGNSSTGPITWRADKWLSGSSSTPHSEFRLRLRNKWIEWVRQCIISKTSSIKYRQTQDLFLSIAIVTSGRVRVNWFSIDLSPSPHDWIWPGHWPFSLWLALMGPIFQVWFWPDMAWVTMLRDSNNHQY